VRGADRVRWTNGMVSNDVASLAPGPDRSGCHALLLTAQGRIVADLHVLAREDELWLELRGDVLPDVAKRLERYVIADDVLLSDESAHWRPLRARGSARAGTARASGRDADRDRERQRRGRRDRGPRPRSRARGDGAARPPISSSCPRRRRRRSSGRSRRPRAKASSRPETP
jgi:folate-binding Fe-S cluster repair protein YgfZ